MDTYENNEYTPRPEPAAAEPAAPETPAGMDTFTGFEEPAPQQRKPSPFADSPYTFTPPVQQYRTPPAQKPKKRGRKRVALGIVAAVVALLLVAGACAGTAALTGRYWEDQTEALNAAFQQKIQALEQRILEAEAKADAAAGSTGISGAPVNTVSGALTPGQVYAQNVNSVVAISNQATTNIYGQVTETASSGSGFIISEDGYVISNYHVVKGANTLTVITYDGTEYPAALVGYDESNDVSLLKVEATGLVPVTIGSSDALIVGDQVVAIGNPLGELTSTLTVGYISAKDRTINTDGTYNINMMQTDAAINSGNSGGPLFNMKGEVVGITTAKYSGSSNSGASIEGIGFAIPIDDVLGLVEDLQEFGYVKGAYLGISVITMDESVASAYGLPTGSKVDVVESGSCAEAAGMQVGDIITAIGGKDVAGNSDLLRELRRYEPGDTTTITVFRGGKELDMKVTLDEKPAPEQQEEVQQPTVPSGEGQMPSSGDAEEWFNYFYPFFGG